jgi:hypothetical protein
MSPEEEILFAELPQSYVPIVRFALRTGCRAMECINLRWSDMAARLVADADERELIESRCRHKVRLQVAESGKIEDFDAVFMADGRNIG